MGYIPSAATTYSVAYLTELGRKYLFDAPDTPRYITLDNGQTIDRLKIERFALADDDVNYNLASQLASGEVLDLSGDEDNSIKGAKGRIFENIIYPGDADLPPDSITSVVYQATQNVINFDMGTNITNLPVVITQQLMTYIDSLLVTDGFYNVTPTNYGKIQTINGELIIVIQNPTSTSPGYRLRIFYPKTGINYNKMTFQFEKSPPVQSVIITNTINQTLTQAPQNLRSQSLTTG